MIELRRLESLGRRLAEVGDAAKRSAARFHRELADAFEELRALRSDLAGAQSERGAGDSAILLADRVCAAELGQCRANMAGAVVRVDAERTYGDDFILVRIVGPPLPSCPVFRADTIAREYPIVLAGRVVAAAAPEAP
jgi:hypothetical protein